MAKYIPLVKLEIMGVIQQEKEKGGWFKKGAVHIGAQIGLTKEETQDNLRQLIHDKYLEQGQCEPGMKHIPVRLTQQALAERVHIFRRLFPDIKSVLFSK